MNIIIQKCKNKIKYLKEKLKYSLKFYNTVKDIKKIKAKKIIMFNTPCHGNIGDAALTLGEKKLLSEYFPDLVFTEINCRELAYISKIPRNIANEDDIIGIHAGGYLGTLWMREEINVRKILETFKDKKIIIFPQTIFYSDDEYGKKQLSISKEIYSQCSNLNIFARERYSEKFFNENFNKNNIFCCPDMVLYLDMVKNKCDKKDILLCLRNDKEKTQDYGEQIKKYLGHFNENIIYTDTFLAHDISIENRELELDKKLEEFSKAKLIVTDRLHGMVFAALAQTPCVVVLSQSYKVQGVYEWIKDLDYIQLVNNMDDFAKAVEKVLSVSAPNYQNSNFIESFSPLISKIGELYE